MIHARIQEFSSGGGGGRGSRSIWRIDKVFLYIYLCSHQFILQKSSGYFYLLRFQWGGTFSRGGGGSNLFQGGPIAFSL